MKKIIDLLSSEMPIGQKERKVILYMIEEVIAIENNKNGTVLITMSAETAKRFFNTFYDVSGNAK